MRLTITSLQNPRVKHVVKLRDRKQRQREGLLLVEGFAELLLALESGARPQTLFVCPERFSARAQHECLADLPPALAECELLEVSAPVFDKMAYREHPDGWLALFPLPRRGLADLQLPEQPLLLVVEAIEKPGNLGAMLRSADAAGVDAVIVCDPTTDLGNPNVVRSSKGTLFCLPVVEASSAEALAWLRHRRIQMVAATPQTDQLYTSVDLRGPLAIVVGTESTGLTDAWLQQADLSVRIPMVGRVNSLNVATSAALLLFEAVRQRT